MTENFSALCLLKVQAEIQEMLDMGFQSPTFCVLPDGPPNSVQPMGKP
jgi:hypothetical protein